MSFGNPSSEISNGATASQVELSSQTDGFLGTHGTRANEGPVLKDLVICLTVETSLKSSMDYLELKKLEVLKLQWKMR